MNISQRVEFCQELIYFFWKICFSFRTSWKELIWCTNDPNVHICIFCKRWSFTLGWFFPVSILNYYLKKWRSSHLRCSIKKLFLKTSQYSQGKQEKPVLESLFNLEYCEIFKSAYFEEHLRTTACENVFMKLRKIKNYSKGVLTLYQRNRFFQNHYQKQLKMLVFIYMIILWK